MKKLLLLSGTLLLLLSNNINAQDDADKEFKPTGKMVLKVFSNFHADISGYDVNKSAFEVSRAYLGYDHKFSKNLSGKVVLDVGLDDYYDGSHDDNKYDAYLKIAGLKWKATKKLTIEGGMISPKQFKIQEKFWGYRYMEKSFQDKYKFGSSADLGLSAEYKFNKYVTADVAVYNGEGYKNVSMHYGDFRGAAGITISPIKRIKLRVYYDIMNNNNDTLDIDHKQNQSTLASFIGIQITDKFRIGGEYNYQTENKNVRNQDLFGYSIYTTYSFCKKFEVFGRVDKFQSNKLTGEIETWNYKKDAMAYIAGFQYAPVKGVKLALNFRHTEPEKPNEAEAKKSASFVYLSLEFKL